MHGDFEWECDNLWFPANSGYLDRITGYALINLNIQAGTNMNYTFLINEGSKWLTGLGGVRWD